MLTKNQKTPAPAIVMDARKFLHAVNESAQSKVNGFTRLIKKLGEGQKADWSLIALHPNELFFEDVGTHVYYRAAIKRSGSRLVIEDIQRVIVVEEKKEEVFDQFCNELVNALADAISEDRNTDAERRAEVAFNKIESCRFRPSVVPASGWVRTKDGRTRHVPVMTCSVDEKSRSKIVESAVKALRNDMRLEEGKIVSAVIVESGKREQIVLPVDELVRRRVVARQMKAVAEGAWRSPEFVEHVKSIAGMIHEQKVNEAVRYAAQFLREYQEFALLNRNEAEMLISNALATEGCFNQELAEDVSLLFHKTALKINRQDIVESWKKTAQKAEFAPLLEEVHKLEDAVDFETAYDTFLHGVFTEAADVQEVRRLAYLNSMKLVRNFIPEEDAGVKERLQELITRLEDQQADDAAIREAEDLLASVSEELMQAVTSLDEFDKMPGSEEEMPELPDEAGEEEMPPEVAEMPPEGEEEVPPAPTPPAGPPAESVQKNGKTISEMAEVDLGVELEAWQKDHQTFVQEDGIKDCMKQLNEYVDRTTAIKADALTEGFRAIRDLYAVALQEGKGYFSMPSLSPLKDVKVDGYTKCDKVSKQPAVASGKNLKDEGEKMDVQGGKAIEDAATAGKPKEPAHSDDHPLTSPGKGPAVKGVAESIAAAMEAMEVSPEAAVPPVVPAPAVEGKVCEACKTPMREDEMVCPKCKAAHHGQEKPGNKPSGCTCPECMEVLECEAAECPKCGSKKIAEDQYKNPKIPAQGLGRSSVEKGLGESINLDEIESVIAEIAKEMDGVNEAKKENPFAKKKDDEDDEDDKKDEKKGNPFAKKNDDKEEVTEAKETKEKKGDAKEPGKEEGSPIKFTKKDTK
ncbi:MAG: zinc ribbon domain-containing protein [Candidatus Nanopelagicaceae bacterium]|nr:zinc ribbon domain-containing protein [Candidatus Nanopelagicaceae bacterium]